MYHNMESFPGRQPKREDKRKDSVEEYQVANVGEEFPWHAARFRSQCSRYQKREEEGWDQKCVADVRVG